jgi:hypothetical protein
MLSVKKLIIFDSDEIIFNNKEFDEELSKVDYPVNIISFLGEARFGKSTLINVFLSYLLDDNIAIFKTSQTNKHCTTGIDYCFVKTGDQGYLILDCQGINHGDSSNDCKLMLLTYELSDLIIFTDKKINNGTLKVLEPMNMFERYMPNIYTKSKKPILVLRCRDYDLDDDISTVLGDLLEHHNDQYNSLRKTIRNIYKDVIAMSTEMLSKTERRYLNNNDYDLVLKCEENGFLKLCVDIAATCKPLEKIIFDDRFTKSIEKIIDVCNTECKIDSKVFDVVTLNLYKDLNEYFADIDDSVLYEQFSTNHTENMFSHIIKLKDDIVNKIKTFDDMFANCDSDVITKYRIKLTGREEYLDGIIDDVKTKAMKEGTVILREILDKNMEKINEYLGCDVTKIAMPENIVKDIIDEYNIKANEIVVGVRKMTAKHFRDKLTKIIYSTYREHYNDMNKNIDNMNRYYCDKLDEILTYDNVDNIQIIKNYMHQPFIDNVCLKWKNVFSKKSYDKFIMLELIVKKSGDIDERKIYYSKDMVIKRYNCEEEYLQKINEFILSSDTINNFIIKLKSEINKIDMSEMFNLLTQCHPYLEFVHIDFGEIKDVVDELSHFKHNYLEKDSYESLIIKLFGAVNETFSIDMITKLFTLKVKNNVTYIKFRTTNMASKYVISKVQKYWYKRAYKVSMHV